MMSRFSTWASVWLILGVISAKAEAAEPVEYRCQVMTLRGTAYVSNAQATRQPLKEGDTLGNGDILETDAASFADLVYDPD